MYVFQTPQPTDLDIVYYIYTVYYIYIIYSVYIYVCMYVIQAPQPTDLDVVFEVVLDRRTLIVDPDKLGGHPHYDLIGPFPIRTRSR